MPADLLSAISHAHLVLGWQENLMEGEMPPVWMWHLDWELDLWFERVEEERKARWGGGENDEPEMMSNDLAKGRK